MKCITNGKEVLRVNDKEAEHYIEREGWSYCEKREKVDGFYCPKCGKKFRENVKVCDGCNGKLVKGTITVPAWK